MNTEKSNTNKTPKKKGKSGIVRLGTHFYNQLKEESIRRGLPMNSLVQIKPDINNSQNKTK
jgi:hypothetical protein